MASEQHSGTADQPGGGFGACTDGGAPYTATMLTQHPNYLVSFGTVLPPFAMAESE
jgi:hypothetical protein